MNVKIGDKILRASVNVRDLGAVVDSVINMDTHVISVWKSSFFRLRNISAIRLYLDFYSASQIIHILITFRFYDSNSLPFVLSDKSLKQQRKVQNAACKFV